MRHLTKILGALVCIGALATGHATAAPLPSTWETVSFQAVVHGTSTVHDWSVESARLEGEFELTATSAKGSLRIPAKSLSGGPKGLNEKMYVALKVAEHPMILFAASDVAWPSIEPGVAQPWPVKGVLTVAGTRREISLPCRVTKALDGQLAIEAAVNLKLTDFAIKPPTFMAVVRTGDAVNVQVRWVLRPAALPVAVR